MPARLIPVVLLTGAAIIAAAACADGDSEDIDERLASLARGVVVAALAGDTGRVESFAGALPEGLPVEPPLYDDATLIGSTRRIGVPPDRPDDASDEGAQVVLYFIVLDTDDGRERVFGFYADALDEAPWRLDASASARETDRLDFSNADHADISGIVQIVPGEDGGRTSIFISLQDAGARLDTATPAGAGTPVEPREPEPAVPVLERFPEDVPVPSDAVVTSTAFQRAPSGESFLLVFLTEENAEDIATFYREEFEELGWTAEVGEPVGEERRLRFDGENATLTGEIIIQRSAENPRLREVDVRVRVPAVEAATPTPTPAEATEP